MQCWQCDSEVCYHRCELGDIGDTESSRLCTFFMFFVGMMWYNIIVLLTVVFLIGPLSIHLPMPFAQTGATCPSPIRSFLLHLVRL